MKKKTLILLWLVVLPIVILAQVSETGLWSVKNYSEEKAKSYFDNNYYLHPLEGIWQSTDGFKYSIEKDVENHIRLNDKFRVIVLESSFSGWHPTQIKGFISLGSVDGVYSMKYYTQSVGGGNTKSQNVILIQESPILMKFQRIDNGKEILLYKLYPKATDVQGNWQTDEDETASKVQSWSGSSVVIGDKYIATNYHVIEEAKSLRVCGIDGNINSEYEAEIIASDKYNDLAILKITDIRFDGFDDIKYGSITNTIDVGSSIYVLGYPLTSTMGNNLKLTTGVVSSKSGFQGDVSQYQISAAVQPGNSGGPLFDYKGNLVGIVSAKHVGAENVGYAIKLSYLKNLIESTNEKIVLPNNNTIVSNSLSEQVKAISPFVLMIKASNTNDVNQKNNNQRVPSYNLVYEAKKYMDSSYAKFSNDDYSGAYSDVCKSVDLYPTPESHRGRGFLALYYVMNYEQAIESFLYCIEKEYDLEDSYRSLGDTYFELENYTDAISAYNKVISINAFNVDVLYMRGLCKSLLGNNVDAIIDYKEAIKYERTIIEDTLDIGYATIYNNIAYAYIEMNDLENAKFYIKEALKRDRGIGYIWGTNGELAYKLGDYQECINSMNNAITIDEDSDNSYFYRGLARIKLNYIGDGYNDLEKAKQLGMKEAEVELAKIDVRSIDFSETFEYSETFTELTIKKSHNKQLRIIGIEKTNEATVLHFEYTNTDYVSGGWYSIDSEAYIRDKDSGEKYTLLTALNCEISPDKTPIKYRETVNFTLIFPAIPIDCKTIDFVEPSDSDWKYFNIQLK